MWRRLSRGVESTTRSTCARWAGGTGWASNPSLATRKGLYDIADRHMKTTLSNGTGTTADDTVITYVRDATGRVVSRTTDTLGDTDSSGQPIPAETIRYSFVFTGLVLFPLLLVWIAIVSGRALGSVLRERELPGGGLPVLVMSVQLSDRKWASRRFVRTPEAAKLLIGPDGLEVTWADLTVSSWGWQDRPIVTTRKLWAAHTRADAVTLSANGQYLEYVPFETNRPMRGSLLVAHLEQIRRYISSVG
jgi:hypothetical protein